MAFGELAKACRLARVQLSHAGHYKTPEIHWDRATAKGRPFFYFAYGAACAEVAIDTLTGEMRVLRADLLHDVGASINPALDMGQVEGALHPGHGLADDRGARLRRERTAHDPRAGDLQDPGRVRRAAGLQHHGSTPARTPTPSIYRSKAVGEPPLMLAISVYSAILDAVHATNPTGQPRLEAPCTPESILNAIASLAEAG